MSMYMTFFLRGNDKFYPIGTYNRASAIYQMFDNNGIAPWEKISPITYDNLAYIKGYIKENIDGFKRKIDDYEYKIEAVKRTNNSLEEKMEFIDEYMNMIDDYKDRVEELQHSKSFSSFIEDIMDEYKYTYEEKAKNPEEYVYVGIEIGCPTEEDIC